MPKKIILVMFAIFSVFLAGCGEHIIVNGVSYRVMNREEEKEMLSFARLTLINAEQDDVRSPQNAKNVNQNSIPKLTAAQKNYIRTTMPEIRISYNGDKSGRASYEWICADNVMVRLNCEGEFLSSNMRISARKINLNETIQQGQKSGLEKLTFKEIK